MIRIILIKCDRSRMVFIHVTFKSPNNKTGNNGKDLNKPGHAQSLIREFTVYSQCISMVPIYRSEWTTNTLVPRLNEVFCGYACHFTALVILCHSQSVVDFQLQCICWF